MDQGQWLRHGIERGYCSELTCQTHDIGRLTDEEAERFEDGDDPCVFVVRVWEADSRPRRGPPPGSRHGRDRFDGGSTQPDAEQSRSLAPGTGAYESAVVNNDEMRA
jgi:hypothetical protein